MSAVRARLREVYGIPRLAPHGDAVAELVLTVLSQNTSDRNRDIAFLRLRARFGGAGIDFFQAVRDAPLADVEEAIRPGGISKVKSRRIQQILRAISDGQSEVVIPRPDETGGRAAVEQARDRLTSLPGVGRKTAACVLLFAFGSREVPVNTHVSRVGMRLELLRPGAPFEELHDEMLALTPPGAELELHVNLLRHGRRTCHARSPACGECALARMCPSRR